MRSQRSTPPLVVSVGSRSHLAERHLARQAEQEADVAAYHVLVAESSSLLGRVNLYFVEGDSAEPGSSSGPACGQGRPGCQRSVNCAV